MFAERFRTPTGREGHLAGRGATASPRPSQDGPTGTRVLRVFPSVRPALSLPVALTGEGGRNGKS